MRKITRLFGDKRGDPQEQASAEKLLTERIAEMTAQLIAAKNQVGEARREERRLAKQTELATRAVDEWEQRAMAAVRAGDDVMAREALLRKKQHEHDVERYRGAERSQHAQVTTLTRALVTLNLRIEEAKHKRNAVVVRAAHADATGALEEVARDANDANVDEMMRRLESKMSSIEAELELSDEAIANLAREARDALRSQEEFTRIKRTASEPEIAVAKPLAKTQPGDALPVALPLEAATPGPQRTKR
jgi:phage shock protein A